MSSTSAFIGYVPEFYDRRMVPLLFAPYADELVARVPAREGLRVLELACGTGVVTKRLREALPASASLVATDLNEAMTNYARSAVPATGIDWRVADMQSLPFGDASFDVVVCQYGLMFPPDKPQAFREARRVLAPGGVLLANVWGSLDENPAMDVMNQALERVYRTIPGVPTPYGYARDRVAADIAAAGWDARLDDVNLDVDAATARVVGRARTARRRGHRAGARSRGARRRLRRASAPRAARGDVARRVRGNPGPAGGVILDEASARAAGRCRCGGALAPRPRSSATSGCWSCA